MYTLIEIHIARVVVLDNDDKLIGECRLDYPRTGEIGFNILKSFCSKPNSAPAYIETFYSESPCAGRVTYKNAAMRKFEKRTANTSYR